MPVLGGRLFRVNCVSLTSTVTKEPSLSDTANSSGMVGFQAQSLTEMPSVADSLTS